MIPRGTSHLLSPGRHRVQPRKHQQSHFANLPFPKSLIPWGGSVKPQRQKRGEGSVPTWSASPACTRAGDAGALALGGISRPTYSQMLWRMEEWKAPLSPPHSQKGLFQLGRKWLHMLSRSGSQALIFGSARRSREATRLSSSSQGRMNPRLQPDTRRGTSHARPPRPSRDAH